MLPASLLLGGPYIILVDNLAPTATPGEIPLGVLTALIGAPDASMSVKRETGTGADPVVLLVVVRFR
ncbi:hypothetical protein DAD99_05595 [Pseudarthrobacter sp. AB1]|nr:hypothetical protein [Pseudarthrobacter sp. AB1]